MAFRQVLEKPEFLRSEPLIPRPTSNQNILTANDQQEPDGYIPLSRSEAASSDKENAPVSSDAPQ